jgi:cell division protein FtsW (lipid II flippase)
MAQAGKKRRFFLSRPQELRLLVYALCPVLIFFTCALLSVQVERSIHPVDLCLPAGFAIAAFIAHGLLVSSGSRADPSLLPLWIALTGLGMSFQYRLSSIHGETWSTLSCLAYGIAPLLLALVTILFGNGRLKNLAGIPGLWIVTAFGIGIAVLATGVTYRGAVFGPGKTTPTECIKPLLILGLAGLLSHHGRHIERGTRMCTADSRRTHIIVIGAWLIPAVALVLLGDLGMLAATGLLLGFLMTMATRRTVYPLIGLICITAAGWAAQTWVGRARLRFNAWLDPFSYPETSGFQIIRSLFAVFNGEFFGKGVGNGLPGSIPLVETDFVYAAIAEEFGWFGSAIILMLVFAIIRKSLAIAGRSNDTFSSLVCCGCGAMWLIQCTLHTGGAIKLIPMTGVPFPGLSTGGSALLVFAVLTGWILAASDENERSGVKQKTRP